MLLWSAPAASSATGAAGKQDEFVLREQVVHAGAESVWRSRSDAISAGSDARAPLQAFANCRLDLIEVAGV